MSNTGLFGPVVPALVSLPHKVRGLSLSLPLSFQTDLDQTDDGSNMFFLDLQMQSVNSVVSHSQYPHGEIRLCASGENEFSEWGTSEGRNPVSEAGDLG